MTFVVCRSTSVPGASVEADLLAIVPTTTYESPAKATPKFDLLSGDDFSSPTPENSLTIVPMSQPESATQQNNALAFVDMLSQTNNVPNAQAHSLITLCSRHLQPMLQKS